ncbi:hypothetical protein BKA64DRAFT_14188 [Cadophora sp. MPI-SDFR-AT-0126]|nr:hypothetical protein BKA64DRAFT_14188 [Leotiomycetes sp. MPI-SDFR-AT-0126]
MLEDEDGVLGSSHITLKLPLESPVTWHVILWILLCLAINSMAQPSSTICGVSSRYRIYLSSSPIITLADAMSALIRMVSVCIHLQTGILRACQMVVLSRSEVKFSESQDTSHAASSRTWPRWLFFIMGPLPAAIKLASFSGIWWTKSWGLMFAVSFVVVELISIPSRISKSPRMSAPELLDPGLQTEQSLDSQKSLMLDNNLDIIDRIVYTLALLVHLGLLIWAIEVLWLAAVNKMAESVLVQNILLFTRTLLVSISLTATVLAMIMGLIWLGSNSTGRSAQQERPRRIRDLLFKAGAVFFVISTFFSGGIGENKKACDDCPKPFIPPPPSWMQEGKTMAVAWYLIAAIYAGFWFVLLCICRRWPVVASALLIEQTAPEASEVERYPNALIDQSDPLDFGAWASLCFFLTNIVVCVLWYAFMYDSTGTANPPWTDIFGK